MGMGLGYHHIVFPALRIYAIPEDVKTYMLVFGSANRAHFAAILWTANAFSGCSPEMESNVTSHQFSKLDILKKMHPTIPPNELQILKDNKITQYNNNIILSSQPPGLILLTITKNHLSK